MISTTSCYFIKSNYHDNYKCTHTTLFNNEFVNSGNSLLDKSLQWMFLLYGNRPFNLRCLSTDCFFHSGDDYWQGFRVGYTISFFVSLVLSLLDFLRLLLIILKYLVYLVFFIKCFFGTQNCAFQVRRGLVSFARCDPEVMFTDVASWSLRLFLNILLFIGKSFIFKDAGEFDPISWGCGEF